jgi:hypothetical protein
MYDIIIHSDILEQGMESHTKESNIERLAENIDKLTEENQRCFLGVLEALVFAQAEQRQNKAGENGIGGYSK